MAYAFYLLIDTAKLPEIFFLSDMNMPIEW